MESAASTSPNAGTSAPSTDAVRPTATGVDNRSSLAEAAANLQHAEQLCRSAAAILHRVGDYPTKTICHSAGNCAHDALAVVTRALATPEPVHGGPEPEPNPDGPDQ